MMIEILRKLFDANPKKSKIVLVENCIDCKSETSIEITPTSSGFGLQGGFLFKFEPDRYLAKCPACYQANPGVHRNCFDPAPKDGITK
jgi:hypothetical protein